jgi:hypothetical protein
MHIVSLDLLPLQKHKAAYDSTEAKRGDLYSMASATTRAAANRQTVNPPKLYTMLSINSTGLLCDELHALAQKEYVMGSLTVKPRF